MSKAQQLPSLRAVIMAGGKGRRFWPKSREKKPKQLLPIGAHEPLVRETVNRLRPFLAPEHIFISCGRDLARETAALLPETPADNFILEPVGRDTSACVGLALEHLQHRAGVPADTVIAVLPADHSISRPARFRQTLLLAAKVAHRRGLIMTIGIVPDRPSPAYGYIQPGAPVTGERGARQVRRFVEKPDLATARRYLRQGFLWNAGMFVFRLDVMRAAYARHLPVMAAGLARIGASLDRPGRARVLEREFPKLDKVSIDYGIMEKVDNAAVVPGDFGWTDVGGWDALYCLGGGDGEANVTVGAVEVVDSRGCYAEGERLVALVGVSDLVVIETADAVLVMRRDREADLKQLTDRLLKKGRGDLL
jgi:mannose-1-phosphate guanylyltransferase